MVRHSSAGRGLHSLLEGHPTAPGQGERISLQNPSSFFSRVPGLSSGHLNASRPCCTLTSHRLTQPVSHPDGSRQESRIKIYQITALPFEQLRPGRTLASGQPLACRPGKRLPRESAMGHNAKRLLPDVLAWLPCRGCLRPPWQRRSLSWLRCLSLPMVQSRLETPAGSSSFPPLSV